MVTRKALAVGLAVAGIYISIPNTSLAVPASGAAIIDLLRDQPLVQDARVFCYNRRTGRFMHWGRCGRYRVYRRVRPRVYCYSRRTGRFLHWGRCRR